MKNGSQEALRDMEENIFDVEAWGETLHMSTQGLSVREEAEALQMIAKSLSRLGKDLRSQWRTAAGMDAQVRPCA